MDEKMCHIQMFSSVVFGINYINFFDKTHFVENRHILEKPNS